MYIHRAGNSSVLIGLGVQAGHPRYRSLISGRRTRCTILYYTQTKSTAHSASRAV